jgi:hypothetical protein
MSYASYLVQLSRDTFTYEMQRDDLDFRWSTRVTKIPIWLGKVKLYNHPLDNSHFSHSLQASSELTQIPFGGII